MCFLHLSCFVIQSFFWLSKSHLLIRNTQMRCIGKKTEIPAAYLIFRQSPHMGLHLQLHMHIVSMKMKHTTSSQFICMQQISCEWLISTMHEFSTPEHFYTPFKQLIILMGLKSSNHFVFFIVSQWTGDNEESRLTTRTRLP